MPSPAQTGQPVASEQVFTPDQARADFRELYAGLKEAQYDINAHAAAADLDRAFAAELAALEHPMSRFELQTRFQRFVARVKIAHTRIPFPADAYDRYLQGGGTVFPIEVRIDNGRVFVSATCRRKIWRHMAISARCSFSVCPMFVSGCTTRPTAAAAHAP